MFIPKKALLLGSAASVAPQDVFNTTTYTGNGATQTITTGLDMAGEGGLVWGKRRDTTSSHLLFDSKRGINTRLVTNSTEGDVGSGNVFSAWGNAGFTLGDSVNLNSSGNAFVSWSFRRAPGFFDVVTYTGNGVAGRQIPHNLGVTPGMIVVKRRDSATDWWVWHAGASAGNMLKLNSTDAETTTLVVDVFGNSFSYVAPAASYWTTSGAANYNYVEYVAYLFAQNDDLIDCGSYVGNGSTSGPVVTCGSGWKPQWLLVKRATFGNFGDDWYILDNKRQLSSAFQNDLRLRANTTGAEEDGLNVAVLSATGFQLQTNHTAVNGSGTYIYMAIRAPV